MIFILKTRRSKAAALEFLDSHIRGDTDLELPDWGKYKEYTKGIHFTRKGKRIKGLYRRNTWDEKQASYKWGKLSVHLRFFGKLYENKNGEMTILIFTYPQLLFWFLFFALGILTFAFWYKQDLQKTAVFSGLFGMGFAGNILDQIVLEFRFFKEFKALFLKKHPFDK